MSDEKESKPSDERKELLRLVDIQKAVEKIQGHPRFSEGKQAWDQDEYYRGYCERQLTIIGEAASMLGVNFGYENKHPDVPWRQIKALRNILTHVYWETNQEVLWEIIQKHVPELKVKVDAWIDDKQKLLKNIPESDKNERQSKLSRKLNELSKKDEKPSP